LNSEHAQAFGGVMFTPSTFLIAPDGSVVKKRNRPFRLGKNENKYRITT